jgi:hypothetical protein
MFATYCWNGQIREGEMVGACDKHGREDISMQIFGRPTRRKESDKKTKTKMGG